MAISNTKRYAAKNNIDPLDPKTWDEEYKKRQKELAGIKEAVKRFEKGLVEMNRLMKKAKKK